MSTNETSLWNRIKHAAYDYQEWIDGAKQDVATGTKRVAYGYQETMDEFTGSLVGNDPQKVDNFDRLAGAGAASVAALTAPVWVPLSLFGCGSDSSTSGIVTDSKADADVAGEGEVLEDISDDDTIEEAKADTPDTIDTTEENDVYTEVAGPDLPEDVLPELPELPDLKDIYDTAPDTKADTTEDVAADTTGDTSDVFDSADVLPWDAADVTPGDLADVEGDVEEDVLADGTVETDVQTPVQLAMLFCIDQLNPCLTDAKVPAEFVPYLSKCVYINDGSYLVNGLLKTPELNDFLDPSNLISVTFSGNKDQPQPVSVFGQELTFEPIEGEFIEDFENPGSYFTGSWSASLFGAEIAKIEAASWDGSINLYFNVNYGGPKTCQAIYNNPCFELDATCE